MATEREPNLPADAAVEAAPHGGDPFALSIFEELVASTPADRQIVFLALAGRMQSDDGQSARGARAEHARRSLMVCAAETGRVPSAKSYRSWHAQQADRREWAAATTISRVFNGWPKALAACGLAAAPDVRAKSLASSGVPYERGEVVRGLQAWREARPDDPMTFAAYHAWAIVNRSSWAANGERLPTAFGPFKRLFKTWRDAIRAAGHKPAGGPRPGRWRGPNTAYTADAIVAVLRECARDLGTTRLTGAQFRDWADTVCAADPDRAIPSTRTIANRFGAWTAALAAAGLA